MELGYFLFIKSEWGALLERRHVNQFCLKGKGIHRNGCFNTNSFAQCFCSRDYKNVASKDS